VPGAAVVWSVIESIAQDVRFALRSFRRTPAFTTVAVLTLALGIGAVTAIFTVTNAVVFRPLPFPDSGRLVSIESVPKSRNSLAIGRFSYEQFTDIREQVPAFEGVATYTGAGNLAIPGRNERLAAAYASAALFRMLGASPVVGRLPGETDERPGAPPVAVITHAAWVRVFGADRRAVGRVLAAGRVGRTTGANVTIVGVLPPTFVFPYPRGVTEYDVWLPITPEATESPGAVPRSAVRWPAIGRLTRGTKLAVAQHQLDALAERLAAAYPETDGDRALRAMPLRDKIVGPAASPLLAFLAAVAFLVLIACANVANLLLARANARRRELAVRAALGAGRPRIARQLITESALLSLAGGLLGLGFAAWAFRAFVALSPKMPRLEEAAIDYRVLAFTFLVVTLAALVSGVAPALHGSRRNVSEALAFAGSRSAGRGTRSFRATVVAELAIALVLLTGGGLMANSFVRLVRFDLGFDPAGLVALDFSHPVIEAKPPAAGKPSAFEEEQRRQVTVLSERGRKTAALSQELLRRTAAVPGVLSAATTTTLPLGGSWGFSDISLPGRPTPPGKAGMVDIRRVSAAYFRTFGIRLVAGRSFDESDREGAAPVAIVNSTMAARLWPGEQAVGMGVRIGRSGRLFRVIGVIADVRHRGAMHAAEPEMYISEMQDPRSFGTLVVKTGGGGAASAVSKAVGEALKDMGVQVSRVRRVDDLLDDMVAPSRFSAFVLGAFSLLALLLALVGVHGVFSYAVVQQTHEIGVRMALGDGTGRVVRRVLAHATLHAVLAVFIGVATALALGRLLRAMLFGVAPTDVATLACVSLLLLAGVAVAAYFPARRAAHVDPIDALRSE
jgi:putative ABC transport system permease protein